MLSRQGLLGVIMIRPCSYQFILEDVLFCCCMLMISNWLVITPLPYRWSSVAFINYLLWRRWRALSLFLAWRSHILLVDIWYLRSNNVMTWSLELNSMMRRLLTLPWSFTLNSVRLMAHHYLIRRSTDSRSAVWFIWRSLAQMAFPKKVSLSWLPPRSVHFAAIHRILRYIRGTFSRAVLFSVIVFFRVACNYWCRLGLQIGAQLQAYLFYGETRHYLGWDKSNRQLLLPLPKRSTVPWHTTR